MPEIDGHIDRNHFRNMFLNAEYINNHKAEDIEVSKLALTCISVQFCPFCISGYSLNDLTSK